MAFDEVIVKIAGQPGFHCQVPRQSHERSDRESDPTANAGLDRQSPSDEQVTAVNGSYQAHAHEAFRQTTDPEQHADRRGQRRLLAKSGSPVGFPEKKYPQRSKGNQRRVVDRELRQDSREDHRAVEHRGNPTGRWIVDSPSDNARGNHGGQSKQKAGQASGARIHAKHLQRPGLGPGEQDRLVEKCLSLESRRDPVPTFDHLLGNCGVKPLVGIDEWHTQVQWADEHCQRDQRSSGNQQPK